MKKITSLLMLFVVLSTTAQENLVTLSGGYVISNIEDNSADATGWRINGTYEYRLVGSPLAHGLSIGYISTTADPTGDSGSDQFKYEINSLPIYYAPKYFFGNKSLEGFVKGALGMHFSDLEATNSGVGGNSISASSSDSGFYGGFGLGGMKTFKEKFYINAEYEGAFLSNSWYRDGFVHSFMAGIGVRF